jgi:hypothetical protein
MTINILDLSNKHCKNILLLTNKLTKNITYYALDLSFNKVRSNDVLSSNTIITVLNLSHDVTEIANLLPKIVT